MKSESWTAPRVRLVDECRVYASEGEGCLKHYIDWLRNIFDGEVQVLIFRIRKI